MVLTSSRVWTELTGAVRVTSSVCVCVSHNLVVIGGPNVSIITFSGLGRLGGAHLHSMSTNTFLAIVIFNIIIVA